MTVLVNLRIKLNIGNKNDRIPNSCPIQKPCDRQKQ